MKLTFFDAEDDGIPEPAPEKVKAAREELTKLVKTPEPDDHLTPLLADVCRRLTAVEKHAKKSQVVAPVVAPAAPEAAKEESAPKNA